MHTITLKVSESAYDQLMGLLKKISPKELEILDESFIALQQEVIADYQHAKKKRTFISLNRRTRKGIKCDA